MSDGFLTLYSRRSPSTWLPNWLTAVGADVTAPGADGRLAVLDREGDRHLISNDELARRLDAGDDLTFQAWFSRSEDLVITVRRAIEAGPARGLVAATCSLDGLAPGDVERVCRAGQDIVERAAADSADGARDLGLVLDPRGSMADLDWEQAEAIPRAALAGLTVLGVEGTVDEVRDAWRAAALSAAVPTVRIADAGDDSVDAAWARVAAAEGLVSPSGELLLSLSGHGSSDLPWLRVRTHGPLPIRDLGPHAGEPELVAADLRRRVTIAVTTEEHETWILVARAGDQA
ncbi:hypothetical protein [Isoptericola cucumis]|uniref:Uncharacterized protein n=1 Tax=Isoptericola cucumis TaxID=1776856 RepID=A0ABQ2BDL9_9MICO|nr:hypothetical protein [Isoptericola cucumis]GGI12213.1 hypothetical protein GCM10007368_40040 [Isoptericola cucumis]